MLQLNIRNFALIESLSIDFQDGFHVFTGETGAGKSILIDAISYLLGAKFSRDNIRYGENKIAVEGIFAISKDETRAILEENGIDFDDSLIIYRETFQNGKSIIKVNGKAVIASLLKKITSTLINIHGQHENQGLLEENMHIEYLDYFGEEEYKNALNDYAGLYKRYMDIEKELIRLNNKIGKSENKLEFLKFQLDEIANANLSIGEEEDLENRFNILSNSEKIITTLSNVINQLDSDDDGNVSVLHSIQNVMKDLRSISKYVDLSFIMSSFEDFYYSIKDHSNSLKDLLYNTNFDESELNKINLRLYNLNILKKKYGDSIEDILKYRESLEIEYDELSNLDKLIEEMNLEKRDLYEKLLKRAENLHKKREEISENLSEKIMDELVFIGMEKAKFKAAIVSDKLNERGMDKVTFLISANPGEPLKSLDKVASGGELSRIMLALKTIFINKDDIPSVIFDEIDTGVSGKTAESIGEKLYSLSRGHQVFCVTHLPQIASFSDVHFHIKKEVINDKTFTRVLKLSEDEKVKEIARMISGENITKASLNNSKEMIKFSSLKKVKFN
ncbi:MAG: DNA repair protein RecN [Oscillospiraceae bacterium]|nr:DNA repair protein RecN [Oscillospiraceae bacterium]